MQPSQITYLTVMESWVSERSMKTSRAYLCLIRVSCARKRRSEEHVDEQIRCMNLFCCDCSCRTSTSSERPCPRGRRNQADTRQCHIIQRGDIEFKVSGRWRSRISATWMYWQFRQRKVNEVSPKESSMKASEDSYWALSSHPGQ